MKYTLESLRATNPGKINEIKEAEVNKVNTLVDLFMEHLKSSDPKPGDIIICHGYNNYRQEKVVYEKGLIDKVCENSQLDICVVPYHPFISKSGALSTSGGYWFGAAIEEITRLDYTDSRFFWCWDGWGSRGHGGMYFRLPVKVWEVTSSKVY